MEAYAANRELCLAGQEPAFLFLKTCKRLKRLMPCGHYLSKPKINKELASYEFQPGFAINPARALDHAPKIEIDSSISPSLFSRSQLPFLRG